MAERQAEGLCCLVAETIRVQDKVVNGRVVEASDAEAAFEGLEEDRARLAAELADAATCRDYLRSRHAALVATIGRATSNGAEARAQGEALTKSLEGMEARRARMWERALATVEENERDLIDFTTQLTPEALRRVDDELTRGLVEWSELRAQADVDLLGLRTGAPAAVADGTAELRRVCASAVVAEGDLSAAIEAKRKRVGVLADLIRRQERALTGGAYYFK